MLRLAIVRPSCDHKSTLGSPVSGLGLLVKKKGLRRSLSHLLPLSVSAPMLNLSCSRCTCRKISYYFQKAHLSTDSARWASHHQDYSSSSPSPFSNSLGQRPPPPRNSSSPRKRFPTSAKLILLALLGVSGTYYLATPPSYPADKVLNKERFTPFELVAREPVSSTSFILTLRPSPSFFTRLSPDEIASQLDDPWCRFDLWSVEVKQPQLQIAREYTPLPPLQPLPGSKAKASRPGELRFLVRAVDGGEVSTYLSRLPVGSRVELRGPHGGFDLTSRLGIGRHSAGGGSQEDESTPERRRVVFLAGGTGIATALQAAYSILEFPTRKAASETAEAEEAASSSSSPESPTRVDILWAVRSRDDVQNHAFPSISSPSRVAAAATDPTDQSWFSFLRRPRWPRSQRAADMMMNSLEGEFARPTRISEQLLDLQSRHHRGGNMTVKFVVDDEGTYIRPEHLVKALHAEPTLHNGTVSPLGEVMAPTDWKEECLFHSQALQAGMADGAPNAGRKDLVENTASTCTCMSDTSIDSSSPPGKNLLLVSGPDGFITAHAGAKPWIGGRQVQGSVGGLVRDLEWKGRRRRLLDRWIVLKL